MSTVDVVDSPMPIGFVQLIGAAAVSDYRPAVYKRGKIKKTQLKNIALVQNPDILFEIGKKKTTQKLIGFALETSRLLASARQKLKIKNLDLIFANHVSSVDNTQTAVYAVGETIEKIRQSSKMNAARRIWQIILSKSRK